MYTSKDLENIEDAINKLQSGKRVVSVAYGDHIVKYADVNMPDLLTLRQRIKSELKLNNSCVNKRHMIFATHKGI